MSFDVKYTEEGLAATYNGIKLPPLPDHPMSLGAKPKEWPYAMITPKE